MTDALLQHCFFPRLLHSAKDALFTFHFFKLMHKLRVPNFYIIKFLGSILRQIVPAMHCCSEEESENLGIFFTELFGLLNHWSKRVNWTKECSDYAAFTTTIGSDRIVTFEDFVTRISEGLYKRFTQNLIACFDKDPKMYMKTRCSLIILNRMSPVFPNSSVIARPI